MRDFKIHGRPRLPWWVYAVYFALAVVSALTSPAKGSEMPKVQTVKIDENALARAIAKALKEAGRKGDSEIAHVNPREKQMLMAQGGAGTRNPSTGMPEYYEGEADPGTDRFGGTVNEDFGNYSEGEARETGFYGGEYNPNDAAFNPDSSPAGPPGTPGRAAGTGLSNSIMTALAPQKPSMLVPSSRLAYEFTGLLGNTVGKYANDKWGGQYSGTGEVPQFSGNEQMGGEGRNWMADLAQVQPAAQPAPAYLRPPVQEAPSNLGLQGLSDIQKRTMMATYGSQGAQSQYRTPEAMRAYGNLIARALIGDNNQVTGNETGTLPIEDQYLRQVFGIQKPNSAADLLDKLRPYWSQ